MVGAPNGNRTGQSDVLGAGAAFRFGTELIPAGKTPWSDTPTHTFTVTDFPVCGAWAGDGFGTAVAFGELEPASTGTPAREVLAIGAPTRNLGCAGPLGVGAGAVYTYDSTTPLSEITRPAPLTGERFGESLAFYEGTEYSFRVDPLYCTASVWDSGQSELLVGAPSGLSAGVDGGVVEAYGVSGTTLMHTRTVTPEN